MERRHVAGSPSLGCIGPQRRPVGQRASSRSGVESVRSGQVQRWHDDATCRDVDTFRQVGTMLVSWRRRINYPRAPVRFHAGCQPRGSRDGYSAAAGSHGEVHGWDVQQQQEAQQLLLASWGRGELAVSDRLVRITARLSPSDVANSESSVTRCVPSLRAAYRYLSCRVEALLVASMNCRPCEVMRVTAIFAGASCLVRLTTA